MPLWRKLVAEEKRGGMNTNVRSFTMESWNGDADILNNALRCLPRLNIIMLNIGTNFAPEHLEEMFEDPRDEMRRLEIRFRPHVQQPSYGQFLKGSYFDTAIETLYRKWSTSPSFTHLSIVQDLPPRVKRPPKVYLKLDNLSLDPSSASDSEEEVDAHIPVVPTTPPEPKKYSGHGPFPYLSEKMGDIRPKTFAQPIVFFDIKCMAKFGMAPIAKHLTHLRLRIPSRDLIRVLVSPAASASYSRSGIFPKLQYLDLSTTNVRLDTNLAALLKTYWRLNHLVLDRVNLFGFQARDKGPELCRELGLLCVNSGLNRSKEKERGIQAWDLRERTRAAEIDAERLRHRPIDAETTQERIAREDQERRDEMQQQILLARSRRGHRSAAHSTFSLRDRPLRTATSSLPSPGMNLPPSDRLHLLLPPLPSLQTLCIGGELPNVSSVKPRDWEMEFHAGWKDGLVRLLGWATHVVEKYERAIKKRDEYLDHERQVALSKKKNGVAKVRPPMDVRMFRYPLCVGEEAEVVEEDEPVKGLVELVSPGRECLNGYKDAVGNAEMYLNNTSTRPPCVLCLVPDCEGPARKGAEGERVDGREGMGGKHRRGCGHLLGRETWG
ncbi:hypothetical protein P7C73_g6797, partial [Tremellales sp. Uapishka_1]